MTKTAAISVRLTPELNDRLAEIAANRDRPKSWVIEQAVKDYVARDAAFVAAVQVGIDAANRGDFVSDEDVGAWIDSLGAEDELSPPRPRRAVK